MTFHCFFNMMCHNFFLLVQQYLWLSLFICYPILFQSSSCLLYLFFAYYPLTTLHLYIIVLKSLSPNMHMFIVNHYIVPKTLTV